MSSLGDHDYVLYPATEEERKSTWIELESNPSTQVPCLQDTFLTTKPHHRGQHLCIGSETNWGPSLSRPTNRPTGKLSLAERAIERNITLNRETLMAGVQLSPRPNKARTRNTPKATSLMQNYADVSIRTKTLNSQKGLKLSPFLLSSYPFNFFSSTF